MSTRVNKQTNEALELFQTLEILTIGQAGAHADVLPGYTEPLVDARLKVLEASEHPKVIAALGVAAYRGSQASSTKDAESDPAYRLATHFLSTPSLAQGLRRDTSPEEWKARIAGGLLLARPMDEVALRLAGMSLQAGTHQGIIEGVRPQDKAHNNRFRRQAGFGPERADVFMPKFMSHNMVFVRADPVEALGCICIMQATVDSMPVTKQGAIGKALELPLDTIADLLVVDDTLVLSDVRPPEPR